MKVDKFVIEKKNVLENAISDAFAISTTIQNNEKIGFTFINAMAMHSPPQ